MKKMHSSRSQHSFVKAAVVRLLALACLMSLPLPGQDQPAPPPAPLPAQGEQPAAAPNQPATENQDEPDVTDLTNPFADLGGAAAPKKPVGPIDPDLPQPFDVNSVTSAVKTSPFNRTVNLSESLVLTGLASIDGKPMATLMDKESKRTYVVSEEPNAQGWRLEEMKPTASIKFSQVKVNIGGEVVTIRHDNEAQEELMKKNKMTPGGGGPPGGPPGGDRGFSRERRGPPPEAVERYNKLSDDAKNKLRKTFEENRERVMNMSPDDRRVFMENTFRKIAEDDEKNRK